MSQQAEIKIALQQRRKKSYKASFEFFQYAYLSTVPNT